MIKPVISSWARNTAHERVMAGLDPKAARAEDADNPLLAASGVTVGLIRGSCLILSIENPIRCAMP